MRIELCRNYSLLRNYPEAIRTADRGITDFPDSADLFRLRKAEAALNEGDTKLARAIFNSMSPDSSTNPFVSLMRFECAMWDRNYQEATANLASYPQLPIWAKERIPETFFEGEIGRAEGDAEKAQAAFEQARQELQPRIRNNARHGERGDWLAVLAKADAALGLREEALRAMHDALELATDPLERPDVLLEQAIVLCWLGDRDQAIDQLEKLAKVPHGATYGDLYLNPTWDSLRGDPRFDSIIASLEPKVARN